MNDSISTKNVKGRRSLRFEEYADLLADAEAMVASDIRLLGNWSLGQILKHLAVSIQTTVDGLDLSFPAPIRFVGKLFTKKRFLNKTLPAGFKIPSRLRKTMIASAETDSRTALEELREAIERVESAPELAKHAMYGKLTREEWEQFNLRHAELHLGFVVPQVSQSGT